MKVHLFFTVSRRLPSVLNLLVLNHHLKDKIKNKTPSSNGALLQRGDGACSFDQWDAYLLPHSLGLIGSSSGPPGGAKFTSCLPPIWPYFFTRVVKELATAS